MNQKFKPIQWKVSNPINISKIYKKIDTDKDGVPDYKDCRRFNPYKQHISKTTKERLKKLPIYVSPKSIYGLQQERFEDLEKLEREKKSIPMIEGIYPNIPQRTLPHIMSKEAKETAPEARKMFLSTIKKYPGVISEIERTHPKQVIIASERAPKDMPRHRGWTNPIQEVYIGPSSSSYSKEHKKKTAEVAYHELTHVRQAKGKPLKDILKEYKYGRYETKEEYEKLPMEREAEEYANKKLKEYHKSRTPSGRVITKILELEESDKDINGEI